MSYHKVLEHMNLMCNNKNITHKYASYLHLLLTDDNSSWNHKRKTNTNFHQYETAATTTKYFPELPRAVLCSTKRSEKPINIKTIRNNTRFFAKIPNEMINKFTINTINRENNYKNKCRAMMMTAKTSTMPCKQNKIDGLTDVETDDQRALCVRKKIKRGIARVARDSRWWLIEYGIYRIELA